MSALPWFIWLEVGICIGIVVGFIVCTIGRLVVLLETDWSDE